jgi:hypothetical protein
MKKIRNRTFIIEIEMKVEYSVVTLCFGLFIFSYKDKNNVFTLILKIRIFIFCSFSKDNKRI